MSSKIVLLFLFALVSCGLKTKPVAPENTSLEPIQNKYFFKKESKDKKKKK